MAKTVGILIPTFNRVGYLRLALESALTQTWPHLMVLVIDNGSTDGTREYLENVTDSRVSYVINEENIGPLGSFNKGIGLFPSDIEWCTILPDDDLLAPEYVEALLAAVSDRNLHYIVQSRRILIDGGGKTVEELPVPPEETALEYLRGRARSKRHTFVTGLMFSRKGFNALNGYPCFRTGMATDDAFIFGLGCMDRLYTARDAISFVRVHCGAQSHEVVNVLPHLQAIVEFRQWMEKQLFSLRLEGTAYRRSLRYLHQYVRHLATSLIARGFAFGPENELSQLVRGVHAVGVPLSLRTQMDLVLLRRFGFNAERWRPYRVFWSGVDCLSRAFLHH